MRLAVLLLALVACADAPSFAPVVDAGPDHKSCDQIAQQMCEVCRDRALLEVQARQLEGQTAALLEQKAGLEAEIAEKCARLKARGVTSSICTDGGIGP
jgi:hypothetical protein